MSRERYAWAVNANSSIEWAVNPRPHGMVCMRSWTAMHDLPHNMSHVSDCQWEYPSNKPWTAVHDLLSMKIEYHTHWCLFSEDVSPARCTSIHFAKNQLFPRLISLSPLAASHPRLLLQTSVRPSKGSYAFFSLLTARSRGFGSNETNKTQRFLLAFASPPHHCLSSLDSFTRWPNMQMVPRHVSYTRSEWLSVFWFRSFHSQCVLGSFHLSFTVLVHYRSRKHI